MTHRAIACILSQVIAATAGIGMLALTYITAKRTDSEMVIALGLFLSGWVFGFLSRTLWEMALEVEQ